MKNLIAVGSLMLLFVGTSFAQNEVSDQEAEVVFRVTLSEADAVDAKGLKDLRLSEVFKGESRTVFLVKANSENIEKAKTEIEGRFDSVRIEEINVAEDSK
jgi:hypothetical protein